MSHSDTDVYDAVVIGAGINGSCAALHLARNGKKTVLVEQFPVPNDRGSSCGQSRFFRMANFSPDSFNPIVQDSHRKWLQLEKETNTSLLRDQRIFFMLKKSDHKYLQKMVGALKKSGITPIIKTNEEFNDEYKTKFDDDTLVVEERGSGVLMASKCLQVIQDLFKACGGTLLDEYPVTDVSVLRNKNGNILIRSSKGRNLEAKAVIICAGPWTSNLLQSLGLNLPLETVRVSVLYWPVLDKCAKTFAFVDKYSLEDNHAYGLPDIEYPGLVKLSFHGGVRCDPNFRDFTEHEGNSSAVAEYIKKNIPWLGTKPVIDEPCMYTMSPDNEMIIGQHPFHKNISFACGFSGTGFKTGPTVGQILAELATGAKLSFDISDFSMNRFKNKTRLLSSSKL